MPNVDKPRRSSNFLAERALQSSAALWFITAVIGQWLFFYYVAAYYGAMLLDGGLQGLSHSHLPKSYIAGDVFGNIAIASHLIIALIILGGGPLQFIPQIRKRFPTFHHWNGRVFVATVILTTFSGLYMVWVRGAVGDLSMHLGLTLNAVLVIIFSIVAVRYAMARKISNHRRWALRLFLVVNGVWFQRVFLWLWMFFTDGAGIDWESFTGAFLTFNNYAQYLIPLFVLELYFYAQTLTDKFSNWVMAAFLFVLTLLMALGIHQAAITIWLPKL